MTSSNVYDSIIARLRANNVSFTIHEHEVARTVLDAETKLPFPKEQFLKTVVFKIKHSSWILAAVKGQDSVDYRKLAEAFDVKRADLVRPAPEEVEAALGMQIGGVGPIALNAETRVVVDSGAQSMDIVYCGVGRNDRTLEIRLADLIQVADARVLPIVRD